LIQLALPNATIIHTVRDPVDTCLSSFSKLFTAEQNFTYDLAELGRYYRHYQALMSHWRRVLPPGRILDVRYEDVVADLEGQARRILAHCGLEWDERCLSSTKPSAPCSPGARPSAPAHLCRRGRPLARHEEFLAPYRRTRSRGCRFVAEAAGSRAVLSMSAISTGPLPSFNRH